jgi:hypothetical protein
MKEDDRAKDIALAEYDQITTQFHNLTEIRFKLLAFLPLGTVAGALFAKDDLVKQPEISLFAFVATLCVAIYNKRNDQYYDELVARAAELERALHIEHGSFLDRPRFWLKYGFVEVDHRWAIGLIYAASASLWAYLFFVALAQRPFFAALVQDHFFDPLVKHHFFTELVKDHPVLKWLPWSFPSVVVIACWQGLRQIEKERKMTLEATLTSLMDQLLFGSDAGDSRGELVKSIAKAKILRIDEATVNRRVAYHWKGFYERRDSRAASTLLSQIIDLPGRWIEDVWSGRR